MFFVFADLLVAMFFLLSHRFLLAKKNIALKINLEASLEAKLSLYRWDTVFHLSG